MGKKGKFEDQVICKLTHQVMEGNHYLNICSTTLGEFIEPILITPEQWQDIESRFVVYSEPLSHIDRIMKPKRTNLNQNLKEKNEKENNS